MVGAVVVTHRTPELAVRCAESLLDAAAVDDVVIVDTARRGGTPEEPGESKLRTTADNPAFCAAPTRGLPGAPGAR